MTEARWIFWVVCLLALSASAEEPPASPTIESQSPSAPVALATVNGEPIHFEDLERQLEASHTGLNESSRSAFDVDRVVERLISDELLAQEARLLGMSDEPDLARLVDAQRRDLEYSDLEEEEIFGRVVVTDEEVRETFEIDYATVTLNVVTVDTREHADELLRELAAGAEIEALAEEHSVDQYSARGGRMESALRRDFPYALGTEVWSLEPGELGEPVRTGLGWSVVRIVEFGEADPELFDKVRDSIEAQLRQLLVERRRVDFGQQLTETIDVSIDQTAADAIGCERLPEGRLGPVIEDPELVLARIGERSVTAAEFGRALKKRWKGMRNEEAALAAKPAILARLVRDEMMRVESERRGYGETPEAQRILGAYRKELLVRQYVREVIAPKIEVTEEEQKAYYEEQRERFRKPPRVHVAQITVEKEEEARKIVDLAKQGTDFAWLARQHSIDRFREGGGDRGWMVPGQGTDATQDKLYESVPGDVLGPVGVPGNYRVLKVDAREEQGFYEFDRVAEQIRSALFSRKFREFMTDHLLQLREASEIVIHEDVLATLQISGSQTEETDEPGAHGHH